MFIRLATGRYHVKEVNFPFIAPLLLAHPDVPPRDYLSQIIVKFWQKNERTAEEEETIFLQCRQCDQIGRFIGLWAPFQSLWQQLICPNLPHS